MTLWERIRDIVQSFFALHRYTVLRVLRSAVLVLAAALVLEVFVFNFNYFTSAHYNTISLNDRLNLQESGSSASRLENNNDTQYKVTQVNHVLEFSNLNTEVHNLWLNFDSRQPAQALDIKIQFTDSAHRTYFDSTEYTAGVPTATVATNNAQSEYLNLNTSGLVNSLRIEIGGEDVRYPIWLTDVSLNVHRPFDFNMTRFLVCLGAFALIAVFRPDSGIYRCFIREHPRRSKAAIIVAVTIEVYLMATFMFMGSNLVGVATQDYNSGAWDGVSPVNTFEVGGDNAQQYAGLAEAMAKGRLYLDEQPPDWLKQMEDPYDKGARDEAQKETGEPYLFDVAYFDGNYYVYFGVVPVLLFYLPFFLLTGASFPTAIGVLAACVAFVLGCSALLDRFARYHFKRVSLGLYLLLQIPLVSSCGVLYLLKFPTFYSLPIMLGLAFSVWGLYFWMRGRRAASAGAWYLAGSLCMALVAGCRPQLLVFSLLAFPLFWRPFITERHLFTPRGAREFACLVAPYLVVAAGLGAYNYARFGSVANFGANYNLTVNDMTKRGFSAGRSAPALFAYFFQPPSASGVFPFLQPAPFDTTYRGQTIKEVTFGGIFLCLPVLWILPFSRRILKMRFAQRSTRTIAGVIIVLLASGVLVALLDAQMAGILERYFADFTLMFLVAAVLLAFVVNENIGQTSAVRSLLTKVLLVAVAASVLYSVLLCLVPETGWFSDIYPWAYQGIVETVQFWT